MANGASLPRVRGNDAHRGMGARSHHPIRELEMKKHVGMAALTVAILLGACGGGGSDSKDLFSLWTRDGDGAKIDLSAGAFNTPFLWSEFDQDGSQCNCVIRAIGDQSNGTFVVNQCYYVRGSSSRDPGCSARNRTGNYTNANSVLTIGGSAGSATFH